MNKDYKKMLNHIIVFIVLISLTMGCSDSNKSNEKLLTLFVKNDSSWNVSGEGDWSFENDELVAMADSTMGYVITKDTYKNFELKVDFYPDSTINSGVFVRCSDQEINADNCFEINIWDLHPNQEFRTGSIVKRVSPKEKLNTIGKWNTYRIRCEGKSVKVWLNDSVTADILNDELVEGRVALQAAEKGIIRFRNVQLKSI